ncbi:conserved hypothetical protein [Listeria ivanovii FSL F6-596]|nr:conserved hypothetical protein [Listeria ivanovii FSL F6-596]
MGRKHSFFGASFLYRKNASSSPYFHKEKMVEKYPHHATCTSIIMLK